MIYSRLYKLRLIVFKARGRSKDNDNGDVEKGVMTVVHRMCGWLRVETPGWWDGMI